MDFVGAVVDASRALESTPSWKLKYGLARWYTFLGTQMRVSRRLDRVLTVSEASVVGQFSKFYVVGMIANMCRSCPKRADRRTAIVRSSWLEQR